MSAAPQTYVLLGDGESPHLLKWARALSQLPQFELWACSSRGFLAGFDDVLPAARRLALNTRPDAAGGNLALIRQLPPLSRWLRQVQPAWIHAHYLTSHGTLAWLAQRLYGVRGRLVGSAWGSDILVTPDRNALWRHLTQRVLRACVLSTSDSQAMAMRMRQLGAGEVMVFPFGLESMPPPASVKDPNLFFANRGLEPIYAPARVIEVFDALIRDMPQAQLTVANDGSLCGALKAQVESLGLAQRVRFVGRLGAADQAQCYDQSRWYLSLPVSDSVSVSVLEAMAHGCVPILSDLPANRELVRHADNGLIVADGALPQWHELQTCAAQAERIAAHNRAWVQQHALFAPCVQTFAARLASLAAGPATP